MSPGEFIRQHPTLLGAMLLAALGMAVFILLHREARDLATGAARGVLAEWRSMATDWRMWVFCLPIAILAVVLTT